LVLQKSVDGKRGEEEGEFGVWDGSIEWV
jgi:hypothetical protein